MQSIPSHANSPAFAAGPTSICATKALEFLSFTLSQQEYGINIQNVQELRGYDTVTRIANAPRHIKGVVDMRIKFNLGAPTYEQFRSKKTPA